MCHLAGDATEAEPAVRPHPVVTDDEEIGMELRRCGDYRLGDHRLDDARSAPRRREQGNGLPRPEESPRRSPMSSLTLMRTISASELVDEPCCDLLGHCRGR